MTVGAQHLTENGQHEFKIKPMQLDFDPEKVYKYSIQRSPTNKGLRPP